MAIHPNSITYIKCKFKTKPDETLPVSFQPQISLFTELAITKNLIRIKATKISI